MAHIIFAGFDIINIVNEIKIDRQQDFNTNNYIGSNGGSDTEFISESGRIISFQSIVPYDARSETRGHKVNDYKALAKNYKKTAKVLTSPSEIGLKGNYKITKFDVKEDTKGNFIIDWEFTEVIPFNVTKKTFRVWGKAVTKSNSKTNTKKVTTKTSGSTNLNSNVKYLLKTCPTLHKNDSHKKCVKSLQKFLQSKGYYTKYKVDGLYQTYTVKAVQGLQKKYKLKVTGLWDKNTRSFFQKQYKYPTSKK